MSQSIPASDDSLYEPLTERELEILPLLAEGLKDREIAGQLHLALKTVKWYNSQIYGKLGVTGREQAVEQAQRLGLLDTTEPTTTRHNLPAQITSFIGRGQEVANLINLLNHDDMRLITILAPGGMGKTRLALEVARFQLANYPDGVFFIALAPVNSAAHLVTSIADALDLRFQAGDDPKRQLVDFLRDKRMLLILDNFEHVLDAAPIVHEILEAAPEVSIMVTSRENLGLSGEKVFTMSGDR